MGDLLKAIPRKFLKVTSNFGKLSEGVLGHISGRIPGNFFKELLMIQESPVEILEEPLVEFIKESLEDVIKESLERISEGIPSGILKGVR